jgi:nitrite reductase (cytochrome c-552)
MARAEIAVVELIGAIDRARQAGATDEQLAGPRTMHRQAQWRLDFVAAENSVGFHAPHETARLLGEAIDFARQGHVEVLKPR